jgi:hypothetical protein
MTFIIFAILLVIWTTFAFSDTNGQLLRAHLSNCVSSSDHNTSRISGSRQPFSQIDALFKSLTTSNLHEFKFDVQQKILMDVLTLDKLARHNRRFGTCLAQACSTYIAESIYELPFNLSWNSIVSESLVATRVADILSVVNVEKTSDVLAQLSKPTLRYFTRLMLESSPHIYDVKIIFLQNYGEELKSVRGYKPTSANANSYSINIISTLAVEDFVPSLANAKRFDWYKKWSTSYSSSAASNWLSYLKEHQRQTNQVAEEMSTTNASTALMQLNLGRFVSNLSYDCALASWHRVVSVPFFFPSSNNIRFD